MVMEQRLKEKVYASSHKGNLHLVKGRVEKSNIAMADCCAFYTKYHTATICWVLTNEQRDKFLCSLSK